MNKMVAGKVIVDPVSIRDMLNDWIDDHRSRCRDPQCHEPANVLAFLAHCAGMRTAEHAADFARELAVYEKSCVSCPHMRN